MSEWLPIETAPKDGTRVLLFRLGERTKTPMMVVASWDAEYEWWTLIHSVLPRPTHWMPLPEPPK